ncbi:MAG: hypothetical protein AAF485_06850 [Chloroflexota bacterium]
MTDWMNKTLLPRQFWTVSSCICELYPDSWIFSWSVDSGENYQQILQLDDNKFKNLQNWADDVMEKDKFGWPNIFLDITTAREFYNQYLTHLPNIKLLSIGLADSYVTEFIRENKPGPGMGEGGVYKKLLQREPVEVNGISRGFEILGDELGGQFHSFVCNSLETVYKKELNISLNPNGLIERYEEAIEATDYTRLDDVGAEPALWQPWLISEYALIV